MGFWHPTIVAYEVHGPRVDTITENGATVNVIVYLPNEKDVNTFVQDFMFNRTACSIRDTSAEGDEPLYVVRPVSARITDIKRKYTSISSDEALTSDHGCYIELTYASSVQAIVNMFGQNVLVTENISIGTEFVRLNYNQFCWDEEVIGTGSVGDPCSQYKPLRNSDEAPGMKFTVI